MPLLASLDLRGTQALTNEAGISWLAEHCPHLEEMVLANIQTLTQERTIAEMLGRMTRLRILDLCGLTAIGDVTMRVLATKCPHLEKLDVTCTSVTKVGLEHLAEAPARSLHSLNISHCRQITRDSLEKLVKSCANSTLVLSQPLTSSHSNATTPIDQYDERDKMVNLSSLPDYATTKIMKKELNLPLQNDRNLLEDILVEDITISDKFFEEIEREMEMEITPRISTHHEQICGERRSNSCDDRKQYT
ncbi:unnamed protein product [Protopolystoma xenopodis]|uniref:F-box/LRR-repeat protein 15-like leucin rich repeat domain-containing protein n=1 Tax=Protopolystoma xenopodis TaxID=117903 RepID=A0A3S5CHA9_9PLAT|nr:unnamed protein product [Protopolystoma xenopodis]